MEPWAADVNGADEVQGCEIPADSNLVTDADTTGHSGKSSMKISVLHFYLAILRDRILNECYLTACGEIQEEFVLVADD